MANNTKTIRNQIKELQDSIIPELDAEHKKLQRQAAEKHKELTRLRNKVATLLSSLTKKKPTNPTISEHALVRYLERKYGFDLNPYRDEILTAERIDMINAGATQITANGLTFKVVDKVITTIY